MQLKAATQLVWSEQEKKELLDYCAADVDADAALFEAMAPAMDIPRALVYGRYIKTVCLEYMRGIPVDADLHRTMAANWEKISRHSTLVPGAAVRKRPRAGQQSVHSRDSKRPQAGQGYPIPSPSLLVSVLSRSLNH
jgi:hypothetical protein